MVESAHMTRIAMVSGLLLFGLSGCQTVLRFTHPTAPEGDFGGVRVVSLEVQTAKGQQVESALTNGLLRGEIPVPVNVDQLVKDRFTTALQQLGYEVCPGAPCGDGALTVTVTPSEVGTEITQPGPRSHSRITVRTVLRRSDGQEPYDFSFWDRRSGGPGQAPQLVDLCAQNIAARFTSSLMPGSATTEVPLEDGGPLSQGVNLLLSSQWDEAIAYFRELATSQPSLDGAWYDLGVAWEARGDWTQALAAYEKAAGLNRKGRYLDAVATARRNAPR